MILPAPTVPARSCSLLDVFDLDELLISSARYYQGRSTGLAHPFAQQLAAAWPLLSSSTQHLLKKELTELITRDDEVRQWQASEAARPLHEADDFALSFSQLPLPLGTDQHRAAWLQVAAHWLPAAAATE